MKTILAAMIVGLSFIGSSAASAQSLEQILGAVAGYHLGNSIGDGDGRRAARVVGATLGYRYGEVILDKDYKSDRHWEAPRGVYGGYIDSDRFYSYCRRNVPSKYRFDHEVAESWVSGCVSRLQQRQSELQAQAYEDGYNGSPY